jgi:hypothetical protein
MVLRLRMRSGCCGGRGIGEGVDGMRGYECLGGKAGGREKRMEYLKSVSYMVGLRRCSKRMKVE